MRNSEFWLSVETDAGRKGAGKRVGPVRVALLFGTMGVALALLLPPIVDGAAPHMTVGPGIDAITTAAIPERQGARQYIVRRSILQEPGAICIMDSTGRMQGQC